MGRLLCYNGNSNRRTIPVEDAFVDQATITTRGSGCYEVGGRRYEV
jgi:hypothetical protein